MLGIKVKRFQLCRPYDFESSMLKNINVASTLMISNF